MIYISSACVRGNAISEVIRQLAENGIRNIELSGGTEYYDGLESDLKILKEQYRLSYVCHAYFPPPRVPFVVNLASCNDRIYQRSLEHYFQCIDMMKRIECGVLSIHAGFLIEISKDELGKEIQNITVYDEDKAYDRFCSAYERIAGACARNGIEFLLENNVISDQNYKNFNCHDYFMMTNYESVMKMKKQMDFHFLLDLGHLYVSSQTLGLDFAQQCFLLKQHIKWLHISENNGMIDEHRPLVRNSEILREFHKLYHPLINVTLETVGSIEEIAASIKMIET